MEDPLGLDISAYIDPAVMPATVHTAIRWHQLKRTE